MIVPASVAAAFDSAITVVDALKEIAKPRLMVLCSDNNWLFDERTKSVESGLAKLEAGGPCFAEMHDLWAAAVVVPTINQVGTAVAAILDSFDGEVKTAKTRLADSFPYDDVHIVAHLGKKVSPLVADKSILGRPFEIQIHTGTQYSWWRATHDQVYKGGVEVESNWALRRVAGQARATLEIVDGILADLKRAVPIHQFPEGSATDELPREPVDWLKDLWRPRDFPHDVIRFVRTVEQWRQAVSVEYATIDAVLKSDDCRGIIGTAELTPAQAILIAIVRIDGTDIASSFKRDNIRVLITPEMLGHEPSLSLLLDDVGQVP